MLISFFERRKVLENNDSSEFFKIYKSLRKGIELVFGLVHTTESVSDIWQGIAQRLAEN